MKAYCKNTEKLCRKALLFSDFDGCVNVTTKFTGCQCCDVCRESCVCVRCESNVDLYIKHNVQCNDTTLLTQTCEHHINYISTGYWDADNKLA